MSFLLPLASTILLGYMFDLREYGFTRSAVYDYDAIKPFTQITEINDLIAEYRLIESQAQFRKFLGVDVATNLKTLVDGYNYNFRTQLEYDVDASSADKVQMALKISLRTVNETVPFDIPQVSDWELKERWQIGTHYVKSIIYGSDVFLLLSITTRNSEHKATIKGSILSTLGRSGILDESFKENFHSIVEENDTGYFFSSFGTVPYYADNAPPQNIDDMLILKDSIADIMKTVNDGKGAALFYEMQPISLLSSKFPLVEISSEIFKKLDDVEKKYEDLRIANDQFDEWWREFTIDLSYEDEKKIADFYEELLQAKSDIVTAIWRMDISTLGSIDQFSEAMSSYGNTNDTEKYRRKLDFIRQQYPSE